MSIRTLDFGLIPYEKAVQIQEEILEEVIGGNHPDTLVLAQHPPVISLGANFHPENLLHPVEWYQENGWQVCRSSRGGDVTLHNPGQLVVYPIFSLAKRERDLHRWLRDLEDVILGTLPHFGLDGRRFQPHTGVWIDKRKVCAIGIKVKKWVSMHGLALNCDNDLTPYREIIPCGIRDYGVTSLTEASGRPVTVKDVIPILSKQFECRFATPHGKPLTTYT